MKTKVLIIGGGPAGLYFASKCSDYLLIESNDFLGGQLASLYPQKDIVDIPGIDIIKANNYIKELVTSIDMKKVHLNERVIAIEKSTPTKVITDKGEYFADNVVIATGLGFSSPRELGIENEKSCKNIFYHLNDYSFLKGKRVAIFGGGDSALDWAKTLSKISDNISLIHRRKEFRGNPETIIGCNNLTLYLPYVPYSLEKEGDICKKITIKLVDEEKDEFITLDVDYVLVNYGNIAKMTDFNFEKEDSFFKVNTNQEVAPHIYAIGDVCTYENKKRRIAPSIEEANKILKIIN